MNDKSSVPAFYNPVQEFNRDLIVLVINAYNKYHKCKTHDFVFLYNKDDNEQYESYSNSSS